MIKRVAIHNFKSIDDMDLSLGRINVFIGENGCGKTNILEAILFGAAASRTKLDNEFLASRGIRMTEPASMRSAFVVPAEESVKITLVSDTGREFSCSLTTFSQGTVHEWINSSFFAQISKIISKFMELPREQRDAIAHDLAEDSENFESFTKATGIGINIVPSVDFLVYTPENSALRNFAAEGQILPIGVHGEGLFAHLKGLGADPAHTVIDRIQDNLALLDWFKGFDLPDDLGPGERRIDLHDRYLLERTLDQRSANEGFLFLLFYFTLFSSPDTPSFFGIENIDSSLNPKLCAELTRRLVALAKDTGKQAIFTTHNPAILDGLDLNDDEQRLFVVYRDPEGPTRVRRIAAPRQVAGTAPMKLSAAFLGGYIGGLPKTF